MRSEPAELVNLTGHGITLVQGDGETMRIRSSGHLRVDSDTHTVGMLQVNGEDFEVPMIDIVEQRFRGPKRVTGTYFIVSGIVAARAKRDDFVVPARVVRENGTVVGAQALARVSAI